MVRLIYQLQRVNGVTVKAVKPVQTSLLIQFIRVMAVRQTVVRIAVIRAIAITAVHI